MNCKINIYLVLCFLLISISGYAQNKRHVILALNPDECSACFGGLKALETIDTHFVAVTAVFKKKYRIDSSELIKSLYLDQYALSYAFSDSLYDLFIIDKSQSSFVVCEKAKPDRSRILKTMSDEMISSFLSGKNNRSVPDNDQLPGRMSTAGQIFKSDPDTEIDGLPATDTFKFTDVVFRPGVNNFIINEGQLYTLNTNFNLINVYDLGTRKLQYTFGISKELMLQVYREKFGAQWSEANIKLMEQNKVVKIAEITDFKVNNFGEVYLMLHLQYLIAHNKDTFLTAFPTLISLKNNGRLDKILPINLEEISNYTFTCRWFHIHKQQMYTNVVKRTYAANDSNKFIGTMPFRGDQFYAEGMLSYNLPDIYSQYNYNFTSLLYYKNYASLKTNDQFFCLDNNEVITVHHFPEKNYVDNDIYNVKYGMLNFKIDKDYVYYIYSKVREESVFYLKFNRKKKIIECDREVFSYTNKDVTADCYMDDEDSSLVYFATDEHTLVAKRMK